MTTPVLNILGGAVCAVAGAGVCAMILNSKSRRREDARRREAEAQIEKSRAVAAQEAAQLRSQFEQSNSTERRELADHEKRLTERETLLNSQFARILQTEDDLKRQRESLERKSAELDATKHEIGRAHV